MRCLYCGKELALLKRWTGGGEFCSDAHRQQYQEEYNQLALNRLLQAKPKNEPKSAPESKPADDRTPDQRRPAEDPRPASSPAPAAPTVTAVPQTRVHEQPAPVAYVEPPRESEPEPVVVEEEAQEVLAPAGPLGFLVDVPEPAMTGVTSIGRAEVDMVRQATPALPRRGFDALETQLVTAGQVNFEPYSRILDCAARPSERRLEVRDFVRGTPVVEINLYGAADAGLETSEDPMEILIFPHPPQGSPPLWQTPETQFGALETELGSLVRLAFATTGLQESEEGNVEPASNQAKPAVAPPAPPLRVETAVVETPRVERPIEPHRVETARADSPRVEQPRVETPSVETRPTKIEVRPTVLSPLPPSPPPPVLETPVAKPPVPTPVIEAKTTPLTPLRTPFLRAPVEAKPVEKPAPPAPEKKPDPVPDLVTKPLPLTLHGLAAGKGKIVQLFPSGVSTGVEIQAPRSSALPLRPVMVLGPAPVAQAQTITKPVEKKAANSTVVIKADPKQPPPRPEPHFSNGKDRKPDVRVLEPERKEPEQKTAPAAAAKAVKEPVAERAIETKPPEKKAAPPAPVAALPSKPREIPPKEVIKESFKPASADDLGLPSLSMPASSGFWSKLPAAGKIGVAAVVVLAVAGVIGLAMKGSGTAASSGPRVVEAGPALPTPDSGWITDWGADPGVRRQRQISVLRPSLNLTDYRMQFQGQIDTKALGWVFRAMDPKNFYVTKLEIVKPGINPAVALVRFAVINGEEEPRSQFPLTMPVRLDTMYKIRFDVVGNHFTTWVQDQKVDDWTDDRLKTGGVGLYSERGERSSLKGAVSIVPLVVKN